MADHSCPHYLLPGELIRLAKFSIPPSVGPCPSSRRYATTTPTLVRNCNCCHPLNSSIRSSPLRSHQLQRRQRRCARIHHSPEPIRQLPRWRDAIPRQPPRTAPVHHPHYRREPGDNGSDTFTEGTKVNVDHINHRPVDRGNMDHGSGCDVYANSTKRT
jgi:hypothetical protein